MIHGKNHINHVKEGITISILGLVPASSMISELVNKVFLTVSFLDKKYTRQAEGNLDETGAR
jgi:hypothetical protein